MNQQSAAGMAPALQWINAGVCEAEIARGASGPIEVAGLNLADEVWLSDERARQANEVCFTGIHECPHGRDAPNAAG